jgi:predicted metal-binding protein
MDKRIFKKCPTLGEYHGMSIPYVKSYEEYREFYKQHKEAIDRETIIYGNISHDRKKLGGDKKIHNI